MRFEPLTFVDMRIPKTFNPVTTQAKEQFIKSKVQHPVDFFPNRNTQQTNLETRGCTDSSRSNIPVNEQVLRFQLICSK